MAWYDTDRFYAHWSSSSEDTEGSTSLTCDVLVLISGCGHIYLMDQVM